MLYTKNNQYPQQLPARLKFPDGSTKTDPQTFTAEDIINAGYLEVQDMPSVDAQQVVFWQYGDGTWVVRDKTVEELRQEYLATVPKQVTMRQARLALLSAGLLDQIDAAIQAQESSAVKIEWEYAQEIALNSPLVQQLQEQLQLTEQQLHDLFKLANKL